MKQQLSDYLLWLLIGTHVGTSLSGHQWMTHVTHVNLTLRHVMSCNMIKYITRK